MSTPTEILYWEILPSIRSAIVFEMKDEGLKQQDIAKILEVTPSAISQYLKQKRGNFEFSDEFKSLIKISVKKIISKESIAFKETNYLIKQFEQSKDLCRICSEKNNLKGCDVCFEEKKN